MAVLSMTCPHCRSPRSPLMSVAGHALSEGKATLFLMCPVCDKPVSAKMNRTKAVMGTSSIDEVVRWPRGLDQTGWEVVEYWPTRQDSAAPSDVPERIASNFIQAEEAASRSHREAAGMAYRRVLELTLKDKAATLKGTLEKRIDRLADEGRLTLDIKDWAHNIRDLGNEATHDEDEPTDDDIADMAAFTRVVLEYLYSMPAKVARRANLEAAAPL